MEPERHYSVVIYKLQTPELTPFLPVEQPSQAGGTPGSAAAAGIHAPRGSTAWDPRVTIVSNPKRADNFRQTILQPASAPHVKLLEDVQVPDLVIPALPQAPPLPTPLPPLQPTITAPPPLPALEMAAIAPPAMQPAPPSVLPLPPAPSLALNEVLPTPLPAPDGKKAITASQQTVAAQRSPPARLLSLSVSPALLKDVLALPLGNRLGAFSISPSGSKQGSPGAAPGSRAGGGAQGSGLGGDLSVSAGPGGQGGGGSGSSVTGGELSITGGSLGASTLGGGTLPPLRTEALVYPVHPDTLLRQPALVVSTGPGGGGGLGVYGVLQCGRIFTIYLRMAPRNWTLQFCAPENDPPSASSRAVVIQMEPPLTPPSARRQFDFHRSKVPSDEAGQVILRGTIREDGSVADLQLLRGVATIVNQAAIAAFARWKFSPALRGGKPVAVEILVGIPVTGH